MSRYRFSAAQRYAVFTVHGEKCYLCTRPIDLKSMQVDHILPELLLDKPEQLKAALQGLGLPTTFGINSYENWLPTCGSCNNQKRATVFSPAPIIALVLKGASEKAQAASAFEAKTIEQKEIAKALNVIERLFEQGRLDAIVPRDLSNLEQDTIKKLVHFHRENRLAELIGEPIKLTPLYVVLRDDGFRQVIKGPYGVGGRPTGKDVDPSWNCPNCGSIAGWSGARCVICGMMDDD